MASDTSSASRSLPPDAPRAWWRSIGPGLITASVVLGPGSILTSSKVGASFGYEMVWVLLLAVGMMMVFTTLGARLGVVAAATPCDLITQRAGRWLAFVIGASLFFVATTFQFGNNLGVQSAVVELLPSEHWAVRYNMIWFNLAAIIFLFAFKNLYRVLEKFLMVLVGLMIVSFAANLIWALLKDVAPPAASASAPARQGWDLLVPVFGMVGTTFSVGGAFYQAYLVRQKGWTAKDLRQGTIDARVGITILGLITLTIMATSATVLRGADLKDAGDVARQLTPLFGPYGKALFCLGLFAAAFSSFLVNAMIGGSLLSDGMGLGGYMKDLWPKIFTTASLLIGMSVAIWVTRAGRAPVGAIVTAQAITVIANPLMAGVMLWLTNRRDVMGDRRNGLALNVLGGIGFLMVLAIAIQVVIAKLLPKVMS
ncbi:MAG: divalent metal cation transporter [Phycisphaerae bacterium]|nr:divalent metal cation transporter [Phycisphaerae bacterium]